MAAELPLGEQLDWQPVPPPAREPLGGAHVLLAPVDPERHAQALYAASHPPTGDPAIWTYLPEGPFASVAHMREALTAARSAPDAVCFTLLRLPEERPLGSMSYLRIAPEHGTVEIGGVWLAAELQRTTAATEALYLLARHAFDDLGYRRVEWKCNSLNAASRRAAERFGFSFEGTFRNHMVLKGRNRDTAWFAMTDADWPPLRAGFQRWLDPENFDAAGAQISSLGALIEHARA